MARIRTVKPEFWTSEQVMECSTNARLMFIGMWNFCDDAGRMKVSARTVKAQIFPADELTLDVIRGMFGELSTNGLIDIYTIDGVEYLQITGWHHQKIDHPQKPKHPAKPADYSPNNHRTIAPDLILREGSLEEGKGAKDAAPSGAHSDHSTNGLLPQPTEEADLFRRGKQVLGENTGGLISKLLKAKSNNIPLARAAIETAATKNNPREWVGRVIRNRDPPERDQTIDPRLG